MFVSRALCKKKDKNTDYVQYKVCGEKGKKR